MLDKSILHSGNNYDSAIVPKHDGRVQILFVNKNDTYYYNGLSNLSIDEYLWFYFHERHELHFDCIYFLSYSMNQITIKDYGDLLCEHFVREGVVRKSLRIAEKDESVTVNEPSAKELKSTILPELNKKGSGVVIRIEDLLEMLKEKELNSAISSFIKSRKGIAKIVVVVPSENDSRLNDDLLLPFLCNQIKPLIVHSGENSLRDILYEEEAEDCLFLDSISLEDTRSIVNNVFLSNKDFFETAVDLKNLSEYLSIITAEETPVDERFGLTFKIQNRRFCYEYISSASGWRKLIKNGNYLSREYLLLPNLNDDLMNHKVKYTGRYIKDEIASYRFNINDTWDNSKEPCVFFPIMILCNEIRSPDITNDNDTFGLIVTALRVYSNFIYFGDKLSLMNRKYISNEMLIEYLGCIKRAKEINRDIRIVSATKDFGASDSLVDSIKQRIKLLFDAVFQLEKRAKSIFVNPVKKMNKEVSIYDI